MTNFPTVQGVGGSLQEALREKSKVQTTASGNIQHIKYDSYSGDWSYGKDNEDATGAEVTIITDSLVHGWHLWVDREVTKRMAGFTDELPEKIPSKEDRKGKSQTASEARGFQCILEFEDDTNLQMSWEHSTDGCRRAIDEVFNLVRARAMEEADYLYPVVVLGNSPSYENPYKDGEMIFPPKLEIVGWRNREGEDAPDSVEQLEDKTSAEAETESDADPKTGTGTKSKAKAKTKTKAKTRAAAKAPDPKDGDNGETEGEGEAEAEGEGETTGEPEGESEAPARRTRRRARR